jgi:hypothetical protein
VEANLTPRAAERLCREAAQKSFDESARSLNCDWGTNLDGKQVQRWSEAIGERAVREREAQVRAYEQGRRPESPPNEHELLVIGVDAGHVQTTRKNEETNSRWRENKVGTVSSYLKGDGREKEPVKLVTTHVATMEDAHAFGKMIRIEAERRGIRQAIEAVLMGDCGNWIDPLGEREFPHLPRIADYHHSIEHLWDSARAALGTDDPGVPALAGRLEGQLYDGRVEEVIAWLEAESARVGEPQKEDGEHHPRKVLSTNLGYFTRNKEHMNLSRVPGQGVADRLGEHRGRGQAVQQAGQGDRAVLED